MVNALSRRRPVGGGLRNSWMLMVVGATVNEPGTYCIVYFRADGRTLAQGTTPAPSLTQ